MLIYFIANTGLRFAEAIGVTPNDLDKRNLTVNITKTWDYKNMNGGAFIPTKNPMSVRTVKITQHLFTILENASQGRDADYPIFIERGKRIFNSTINDRLKVLCKKADIPVISVHGLRHTHASILIYEGVSLPIVSARLGHSKTSTTQDVYTHIIKEMQAKDDDKIIGVLSAL